MGHNLHTPITQKAAWVVIGHSRPPEDGNHMPKHVVVEFGTYELKIYYFLEHLLVFLQNKTVMKLDGNIWFGLEFYV
jgi:hypothetical protein